MTLDFSALTDLFDLSQIVYITLRDGKIVKVRQVGIVNLRHGLILQNVLYSLGFKCNLISALQLAYDENCILIYDAQFCLIQNFISKTPIEAGEPRNKVYHLKKSAGGKPLIATQHQHFNLWHQCLRHPSFGSLSHLSTNFGFKLNKNFDECCDVCHRAKQTRNPFAITGNCAERSLSLIHYDLWGPYHTHSINGCCYFLCILDDFSRGVWICLLNDKTKTYKKFVSFFSMVQNQFGTTIHRMCSDNGTKFTRGPLPVYLSKVGILHETTCANTPKQNGRVERKNRPLLNVTRALRFQASLSLKFWREFVLAATYLINRTPTKLLNYKTQYEALFGVPPAYEHLKVFGIAMLTIMLSYVINLMQGLLSTYS